MRILGISAYYHDSAAALIEDDCIIAAVQEERFTRKKQDADFPVKAVGYCLAEAGVRLSELDAVVYYEKPFLKFERLVETYLALAPRGFASFRMAMPLWLKEKLFLKSLLRDELRAVDESFDLERLLFCEHHMSHAASAFYPSPFETAAILTMDGVGEWATTSVGMGAGNSIAMIKDIYFPHSLGLLYSAFTSYLGFKVNSGEYKIMGLAPYGEPKYASLILDHLIDVKSDGSFHLDQNYFNYGGGLTMTNAKFEALFGGPPRRSETSLTQREMDLAASIQAVTDEVVVRMTRSIAKDTGAKNLCLAGGVALNCVANGKVVRDGHFENVWIQPAAGDAGGALGAALAAYHQHFGAPRVPSNEIDGMQGSYLGPSYSDSNVADRLTTEGAQFELLGDEDVIARTAEALALGKAVGWFQGRMEFGPRALGNRSILADPRSPTMQKNLNLKVKFRESFRPFAPSVLAERAEEWFDLDRPAPYMLLVADVAESRRCSISEVEQSLFGIDRLNAIRSEIPSVTHVDYSARVQTVHRNTNARYHDLLSSFQDRTGCPILVNTSFNVRGEPIVCTPEDAFRCFMGTDIDVLVVGNCFLTKDAQSASLRRDYSSEFEPD